MSGCEKGDVCGCKRPNPGSDGAPSLNHIYTVALTQAPSADNVLRLGFRTRASGYQPNQKVGGCGSDILFHPLTTRKLSIQVCLILMHLYYLHQVGIYRVISLAVDRVLATPQHRI
jgi:hypothetical protein